MKNDELHARPKHLQEHAPTVIHHPEEDETLLARWLRKALASGPRFWLALAGIVLALVGIWALSTFVVTGESTTGQAWKQLMLAEDAKERVRLAQQAPEPAASWALLQAAEAQYMLGFQDLPQNRAVALEKLKTAHDQFRDAYRKAPEGSPQRSLAALGIARTLEARGEVDQAIEQYQQVVKIAGKTDIARRAEELLTRLKDPASRQFYEELAKFQPTTATLPPGGSTSFPFNVPGGSTANPLPFPMNLPSPPAGAPELTPPASTPTAPPATSTLPTEPFAPAEPKPETPTEPAPPKSL